MANYDVGSKILRKEQVLISILLITILVMSSATMVAAASGSYTTVVKPSGDTSGAKDTAAIQTALGACTKGDSQCTVQLVKGTYTISSQITVYGFQGSFIGAGQGQTNIVALGNMPSPNPAYNVQCTGSPTCVSTTGPGSGVPNWAGYPGMGPDGSGSPKGSGTPNPYPVIFTFWGGSIAISGMTITDTSPTPTQGWYTDGFDGGVRCTALFDAILIDGVHASATIDHVSVVGAELAEGGCPVFGGYNIENAVQFAGTMLPSGWTNPHDTVLLAGSFSVTNSAFYDAGLEANWLVNSNVVFCDNTFSSGEIASPFWPLGANDISNTNVFICGNQGSDQTTGNVVAVGQSGMRPGLLPSTVTITGNNFQLGEGSSAVELVDGGEVNFGTPATLSAVVSGNTFQNSFAGGSPPGPGLDTSVYSVIWSVALKSTIVSSNYIAGGGSPGVYINSGPGTVSGNAITGAYIGVWADVASGVHVTGNVIKNSVEYGIAVTSINDWGLPLPASTASNNDKITGNYITGTASGGYDLYWDQTGTGNVWLGNFCGDHTSSPPGLC